MPPGHHTCHHVQNVKNVKNVIQMALKSLLFSEKKITRIAQRLGTSPPGPLSGNLFYPTQSPQPTTFKIIITEFLNNQML